MSTTSESIPMDAKTSAFYAGVAAGANTFDRLRDSGESISGRAASAWFWFAIGTESAKSSVVVDQETMSMFMQGAALRQPDLYDSEQYVKLWDELLAAQSGSSSDREFDAYAAVVSFLAEAVGAQT